jgi:hypothetical protein
MPAAPQRPHQLWQQPPEPPTGLPGCCLLLQPLLLPLLRRLTQQRLLRLHVWLHAAMWLCCSSVTTRHGRGLPSWVVGACCCHTGCRRGCGHWRWLPVHGM